MLRRLTRWKKNTQFNECDFFLWQNGKKIKLFFLTIYTLADEFNINPK